MHADCRVARARAARHEAQARPAGELALRLGHVARPALVAAGDEADARAVLVEAVERGEEALARDAEDGARALRDQGLDEGVPGGAVRRGRSHGGRRAARPRGYGRRGSVARRGRRSGFVPMPLIHRLVNYLGDGLPLQRRRRDPLARCRPHARGDPARGDGRVRRPRLRRRAHGRDRRAQRRRQEAHLLLLRRQGRALPRRPRADLRRHPRRRARAPPRGERPARGDPQPGRVHLALLPRPPRVPRPPQQREHAPRRPPEALAPDPPDELAADRGARRRARARREERRAARRHRSDAALHLDRRPRLLLSLQQPHAGDDLRPRADDAEGARRPPRAHVRRDRRLRRRAGGAGAAPRRTSIRLSPDNALRRQR